MIGCHTLRGLKDLMQRRPGRILLLIGALTVVAGVAAFLLLPLDLNGTAWQLESMQPAEGRRILLSFGMFEISGYDGCNYVRGKYRSNRLTHALSTWDVSVTLMDCGAYSLAQREFSRVLAATTSYELDGDELRLYYNGGGVLIFKKREPTQARQ